MNMTDDTKVRPSFGRFIAFMMVGMGLIGLGMMLLLLEHNQPSADAYASPTERSAVPVEVNFASPELNLLSLDGTPVALSDYRGKVVLVNLWATWCPPCRAEMPALQSFYDKYKANGFELIGINQEETKDVVEPFVQEFGLSFPIWLDEYYQAQRGFNTMNLPSSYVIDRNGRVRLTWIGKISETNLENYVPKIIME